jgi:hypothetical protein
MSARVWGRVDVTDIHIDGGHRAWYEACRCCLSDAHPEIVEALDRERAAADRPPSGTGICEAAEGKA